MEIGSGAGFIKEVIPEIITSDIIKYEGIDQYFDCLNMPFGDESVRFFCMLNVFHHIPNVERFLLEASRCLMKNGRIFIIDQHVGFLSGFIYKYIHNEDFDKKKKSWSFSSNGPLSSANGALAWNVFQRDLARFQEEYPNLKLVQYTPHTPLRYWLTGGLKKWSLTPEPLLKPLTALDNTLVRINRNLFSSFVDIELVKI